MRFRCRDQVSGVASCTEGPFRLTQEGRGQEVEAEAADVAGNTATRTVTVNIDRTPPVIALTASSPQPGKPAIVSWEVTDGLSGVDPGSCLVTLSGPGITGVGGRPLSTDCHGRLRLTYEQYGAGTFTVRAEARDLAGNEGSREVSFEIIRQLLDVILAIDSSGSMEDNDPHNLRLEGAKGFVDMLNPELDRVGVVSWDDDVDFAEPLTDDFDWIKSRIDNIDADGGTNLDLGLRAAIDLIETGGRESDEVTRAIIFLTDGDGDYTPFGEHGSQVNRAKDLGIRICTIGLGDAPIAEILTDMAENTGCQYFSAPTAESLQSIFQILAPKR